MNEVPAGWRVVRLADVLSEPLVNGRSPRPGEGGLPVLRMTALRGATVDFAQSKSSDRSDDGRAILLAEHGMCWLAGSTVPNPWLARAPWWMALRPRRPSPTP